jgi:serine/threonine-protein kinase HipA
MNSNVFVSVELAGTTHSVGVLHVTENRATITSVFSYDDSYLRLHGAYSIDPQLPLTRGNQVVPGGLPGAVRDASPDRWGRNLIQKNIVAQDAGHGSRFVGEVDFLLGVSDATRHGALRFRTDREGPHLDNTSTVPPLIQLGRLRQAAWQISTDSDGDAVKQLLGAGTQSLGGARPKAAVYDGDRQLLAKFSHPTDEYDQVGAECVALDIAVLAGIDTPWHDLITLDSDRALLVQRFDRTSAGRIGYISAMTLTGLSDGDTVDYVLIGEELRNHGSGVDVDLVQLWRRMVFSVALNNVDDHGRNHGFLRDKAGWRLSPVFDVTPDPFGGPRATSMAGGQSVDECFEALPVIAADWTIGFDKQTLIARDVAQALDQWPHQTTVRGVSGPRIAALTTLIAQNTQRIRRMWPGSA